MRGLKITKFIILLTGIFIVVCMFITSFKMYGNVSDILRSDAVKNTMTALSGQANVISLFVEEQAATLKQFASSGDIIKLLKNPDDPECIKAAQKYTENFYARLIEWEGLYIADESTHVLTHSSTEYVGMTISEDKEFIEEAQAILLESDDGFSNDGAYMSPATGQLILNLRMAIYDENNEPVGFVGGGPFLSGMNRLFEKTVLSGVENMGFSIIDPVNLIYTYNTDNSLNGTVVEDESMLAIYEKATGTDEMSGVYYEDDNIISYKYLPDIGLILTMKCPMDEMLAQGRRLRSLTIIFGLSTFVLVLVAFFPYKNKETEQ